ncbi:AMP-binding protein [Mesorhizobium sp. CAU 1732]|uniref:AMP-binding protein n=1 Tax=Mesorhizobium sp. CAU 1732 TaxID=3140358 RepID=UPI0032618861
MILAGMIIAGVLVAWLGFAAWLAYAQELSFRHAFFHAPLAAIWRVDASALRNASAVRSVIYVVSHQSRLDPALMLGLLPTDTLHLLDNRSAKAMWLEPWRELARTIAFNPEHVFVSRRLVRILRGGGRLCVYLPPDTEPDTRTFRLYRAVARIALKADAKVVPVYVSGARHLPLSLTPSEDAPRRMLQRLKVHALEPLTITELLTRSGPSASTASNALFDRVAEARFSATDPRLTLFRALSRAARLHGMSRTILDDATGAAMSYRSLLTSIRALADRFASTGAAGDAVGLLLPNAAPTVATFFALQSAGRIAAMLNYTAGPAAMGQAVRVGDLRLVVSSRAFIQKAQLADEITACEAAGAKILWLEDLRDSVSTFDKVAAAIWCLRPVIRGKSEDAAVMLFTSGSEGTPKAVMLSHRNVVANTAQIETRIAFSPTDTLFNVLPVFHAFGMTGGMVLPLLHGVRLFLYLSPLHYKQIPELASKVRPTILFGTDTFLAAYARTADDGDFSSVRLIVAGAEAVRADTRRAWRERFGADIVEGYGMTETSPVVAVNSATHGRHGTVGRLLPGIRARLEPVEGLEDTGRLSISGPNVMLGYRVQDRPREITAPAGGWHDSGDIAAFDKDGFLTIRGRAKRFAKIAGEMVSLGAVEMLAHALWPDDKHAAIALPDERKGERVVLITTAEVDRGALRTFARKNGYSELALPAAIITVEDIPVLGTGKTDYFGVSRIAADPNSVSQAA